MSQPNDGAHREPHSLAPIQLDSTNDARELAKMRSGGGLRIAIVLVLLGVATVGAVKLLQSMDTHQAYSLAAGALERSDTEHRDAFFRCALPNYQRAQLSTDNALRGEVERATERFGQGYGKLLGTCTPMLQAFQQSVNDIHAPADVSPRLNDVSAATTKFAKAWGDYKEFLQHSGESRDAARMTALVEDINTAWQGYQTARGRAKEALSARL